MNHSIMHIWIRFGCTLVFSLAFMAGCTYSHYDEYIVGKWKGVKWESEGKDRSSQIGDYWFDFRDDNTYASFFGGVDEQGKYYVEGNRLYTKADGENEIVVEIRSLTQDTLRIGMNRGGVPETLVLARE